MGESPDSAGHGEPPRGATVRLREITKDTLSPILRMRVADAQTGLVASNAVSIAQAHYHDEAWFRAIHADETPVGFVLLSLDPDKHEYWVWRFMIAEPYQGRGFGRDAVRRVIEHVRTLPGATELLLSHVDAEGHAGPFYESLGFTYTGAVEDGERIMRIGLDEG